MSPQTQAHQQPTHLQQRRTGSPNSIEKEIWRLSVTRWLPGVVITGRGGSLSRSTLTTFEAKLEAPAAR